MSEYTEGSFTNARNQKIFTVSIVPESATSVLFFFHGLGEYIGRYTNVLTTIATEANIAIYSHDYHGHGKSEPREEAGRAYIDKFDDLIDDASQYLDMVLPKHEGIPWFVGGQSLGGLCAVHLLLKRQSVFAGLILHSAAIDVEWTPVLKCQASIGDCIGNCCPMAKIVPAVRAKDMNADPKLVEEFLNDPDIYHGNVKARTGNEILKGFKRIQDAKIQRQIAVPIYACHGTHDKTTSLAAVKRLMKGASAQDKTMKEIRGAYHEIFIGPEKGQAIAMLVAWVKAHTAAGSTEAAAAAPAEGTAAAAAPAEAAAAAAPAEAKAVHVEGLTDAAGATAVQVDAAGPPAPGAIAVKVDTAGPAAASTTDVQVDAAGPPAAEVKAA